MHSEAEGSERPSPAVDSDIALEVSDVGKHYLSAHGALARLTSSLFQRDRDREDTPDADWALRDVSFSVRRGETLGIVGRNGSGKSTLLEIIAGTVTPTSGRVRVNGRLAALLELGAGFDVLLTGRENVYIYASLLGLTRSEIHARFDEIAAFAELGAYLDEPVNHYSTGMVVRLAFAVAVHAVPEILVVDEALAVGDEAFQRKCFGRIEALKQSGVTLLFVSHAAGTMLELCDRILLLDAGEPLMLGAPRDVIARYHRLIYAPAERQGEIREEIRRDAAKEPSAVTSTQTSDDPRGASAVRSIESERFDAGMDTGSRVEYATRGARISNVRIETHDGTPINVLQRGGRYLYAFDVEFEATAYAVRYGMMFKNIVGSELGGIASQAVGAGVERVAAGSRVSVELPFRARLLPGTYFANAGVVAIADGEEFFLHRIMDVLRFRVAAEEGLQVTGAIDLSDDRAAVVTPYNSSPS